MGPTLSLFLAMAQFVLLGVDIVGFFVLNRLIRLRWPAAALLAFDQVGRPLVDPLVRTVARAISIKWKGPGRPDEHLVAAVTLLLVALCRLVLTGLLT